MAPPDLTPSTDYSPARSGATPAGYGRSCTNCSRAKCKCIIRGSDTSCERCARLGKHCQPIAPARRRVEKKSTPSRTAQLEEKLDDLVSILRSSQGPMHQTRPAYAPPTTSEASFTPTSRLDSLATAATAPNLLCGPPGPTNLNANFNESNELPEPTPAEAELYLKKFRGWLQNFPFMYIAPDMTAADLRRERPFLWLCIMSICSMSVPQMKSMKERIRLELAETVVIKHEPSMDILLGLLAFLGWATMNSAPGWKPFLIMFSQMATSVAYELGLTRSPVEEEYFAKCFRAWGGRQPQLKSRTSEERRALLSLWFLTSLTTSFIGRMDALRWTFHMEESLETLEREKEHSQDGILCTMIRMQLVGDEAHKLLVQDIMRGDSAGHTPSHVYRKSMLNRLQDARNRMSHMASSSYIVQAQSHSTEILIHSMGLFQPSIPEAQRVDSLYACLRSVRAWYDIWFSIPLSEVPSLPFAMFIQLSQTQVALYRLTTTEDPAWDKEYLRNTADLLVILDRTIERFEGMITAYPLTTGDEGSDTTVFAKATKVMKNIKANWEPALAPHRNGQSLPTPNSHGSSTAATAGSLQIGQPGQVPLGPGGTVLDNTDPALAGPPITMDFTDLAWMTDVFGPWEF